MQTNETMSEHIISGRVDNYKRPDDYDGVNDYYVNPEWQRRYTPRFPSTTQEEIEIEEL